MMMMIIIIIIIVICTHPRGIDANIQPLYAQDRLQKYLETIPGRHSIDSLQKSAILGISHIIRKVLQAKF
jgi:hypothetical protein